MNNENTLIIKEKENPVRKKEAYVTITAKIIPHNPNVQMSEEVKTTAPADQKYLSSRENKRAYILKFKAKDGSFTYSFVGKKPKVKNCYISTLYITNKDFKDNELDKVAVQTLNEIESYLK